MSTQNYSGVVRQRNAQFGKRYSEKHDIPYYLSLGKHDPVVMFFAYNGGCQHGNFHKASYESILSHPNWEKRLHKIHPNRNTLPAERQPTAKELDSSNSSDALLMNIFCFPGIMPPEIAGLFNQPSLPLPEFGINPRLPKRDDDEERTELDMRLGGNVIVEAKLTERDFTTKPIDSVNQYSDLTTVFDTRGLPMVDENYESYQLIRNVLDAYACKSSFYLLCDETRLDLLEAFETVKAAIILPKLRSQCNVLTWQQIAKISPPALKMFLEEKYGIV